MIYGEKISIKIKSNFEVLIIITFIFLIILHRKEMLRVIPIFLKSFSLWESYKLDWYDI